MRGALSRGADVRVARWRRCDGTRAPARHPCTPCAWRRARRRHRPTDRGLARPVGWCRRQDALGDVATARQGEVLHALSGRTDVRTASGRLHRPTRPGPA
ncbi:MAG: hypothetical protein AVDCRST_MAG36-330 [uncultured Nocardioidaceae bacterium]|uniref:Uncharacterized protein n=1 Tax=uncultured Nocardioidaceae bacterium TaxID=253824 RepID=A0A6J4L1L5_9ACTN|nr:MAG: hypothetical protein AVDCRST_MAG36-330 [uncultured Nocardioidaceae bacterium]